MTTNGDRLREHIRRYLDTGASLSKMSRRELEDMLGEFLHGAVPTTRDKIEDVVDDVRAASRRSAGFLVDLVRSEVHREVDIASRRHRAELADVVDRLSGLFGDLVGRDRSARAPKGAHQEAREPEAEPEAPSPLHVAKRAAAKKTPAKRDATKSEPAKRAAAKKTAAKKTAAKRSPAKKAAAKKAPSGPAGGGGPAGEG